MSTEPLDELDELLLELEELDEPEVLDELEELEVLDELDELDVLEELEELEDELLDDEFELGGGVLPPPPPQPTRIKIVKGIIIKFLFMIILIFNSRFRLYTTIHQYAVSNSHFSDYNGYYYGSLNFSPIAICAASLFPRSIGCSVQMQWPIETLLGTN